MNFEVIQTVLKEKGYTVSVFEYAKDASDYIDAQIDRKTVGMGGSVTLEELGLYEKLAVHNTVHWHQRIPEGKTSKEVRVDANASQIYISSVNGLAETGEIINIDGVGNRVAATFFGHEKVYLVVGKNKIAADYERALYRARNVAAPLNAKRLGVQTPCAVNADRCYDCKSPARICRGLSVFWSKPMMSDIEVVLINEDLGY